MTVWDQRKDNSKSELGWLEVDLKKLLADSGIKFNEPARLNGPLQLVCRAYDVPVQEMSFAWHRQVVQGQPSTAALTIQLIVQPIPKVSRTPTPRAMYMCNDCALFVGGTDVA